MTSATPLHSGAERAPTFPLPLERAPTAPRAHIEALGQKQVHAGYVIYSPGHAAGRLYKMSRGHVIISQTLPDGRRSIVDLVAPGRYFGFCAEARHDCVATTSAPGRLSVYHAPYVLNDPVEARTAFASAVAQLQSARNLASLRSRRAVERLAQFLLDLAPARAEPCALPLPLSRGEIGDLLELKKETVSRCFAELRDAGVVVAEGRRVAHVLDRIRLAEIANGRHEAGDPAEKAA